MKHFLLFFLVISTFQAFGQEPTQISIRENFFNYYTFSQKGKKINSDQVKLALADYPETLKKYVSGQRSTNLGSGMRIATTILLTSGLIYFIADNYSIRSRNVFLVTSSAGVVMGFIAPGIIAEGKRNVSDAIQEYNYQIHRSRGLSQNEKSLEARNPYVVGWRFNF